jgi:hypothetical protein
MKKISENQYALIGKITVDAIMNNRKINRAFSASEKYGYWINQAIASNGEEKKLSRWEKFKKLIGIK